jgi:perosamine synthetase
LRKKSAKHFMDAMAFCDYLKPQFTPEGFFNSYYTLGAVYTGKWPWEEFRKSYIKHGGDGIYGAWSVPYQEPALWSLFGDCPVAESLQPKLMQFKTNYRDEALAIKKAEALYSTIMDYSRGRDVNFSGSKNV